MPGRSTKDGPYIPQRIAEEYPHMLSCYLSHTKAVRRLADAFNIDPATVNRYLKKTGSLII